LARCKRARYSAQDDQQKGASSLTLRKSVICVFVEDQRGEEYLKKPILLALICGIQLLAPDAMALDGVFAGTWTVVSPTTQDMHGARLRFSDRKQNSVFVQLNQMSGTLRESDGAGGSNYVVRNDAFDCYYDVVIVTGRKEMTWHLAKSGGAPCVVSFTAHLDP
jgi:hypothetical protein